MKKLRKLLRLTNSDRQLLLTVIITMTMIRLGLWLLSWATMYKLVGKIAPISLAKQQPNPAVCYRVVWAVETVSHCTIPIPKCLARALVTYIVLARQGYATELRIGVAKNQQGYLEAHAWVESQNQVLIGRLRNLSKFTPLPALYRKAV